MLTTLGTARKERRLSACAYNYTMEVGFVGQIRLTQQKIFGKLEKKNSCSVEGCVKLHWNYTWTIYISIDYTQSIPTLAIL